MKPSRRTAGIASRRRPALSGALRWMPVMVALAAPACGQPAPEIALGTPIVLTPAELAAHSVAGPVAGALGAGLSVDRSNRTAVADFYHCQYVPSEGYETRMNWAGNVAACIAGTVAPDFHDDTLRRINYYRAMVGLNADITLNATKNAKCQKAALIMSRNGALSHNPLGEIPTWACLSVDGAEAAGQSNLSLGHGFTHTGPDAVDGQIRDDGANNVPVGHRRWLLYPPATEMGNGGIPYGAYASSAAIWVTGGFGPPPASPAWVGWPNAGHVPYDLVPARWSFSIPGADFDSATVTMTEGGSPVPVTKIHPTPANPALPGLGDATIVWEPSGLPAGPPAVDTAYQVTISGVAGATYSTYAYDVTLIDPFSPGNVIAITGPAQPFIGVNNQYAFNGINGAAGYTLRAREFTSGPWTEGAEPTDPNLIIDGTDPSYSLTQSTLVQSGAYAFHMAFNDPPIDQEVEIDRTLVPTAASMLTFQYRRRWSSVDTTFGVEVSVNDGVDWTAIWSENGVCPVGVSCSSALWDTVWIPANVSLSAYDGLPVRLRFVYLHNVYFFAGTDPGAFGFVFDSVTVSASSTLEGETTTPLPAGAATFVFQPANLSSYLLDVRADLSCHSFDYGMAHAVQAQPAPSPMNIIDLTASGGTVQMHVDAMPGAFGSVRLEQTDVPGSGWQVDTGAVYHAPTGEITTPAAPGAGHGLYRAIGAAP